MWRIYDCLTTDHNFQFVLIAALICIFGSGATFTVSERIQKARKHRNTWLVLCAVCSGATIWATHFITMLAYKPELPITFEFWGTLGSLLAGVLLMGAGHYLAALRQDHQLTAIFAGLFCGTGVVALHYLGMSALRLPGRISYDQDLVLASVILAWCFGILAFVRAFGAPRYRSIGHALLAFFLMVNSMHFTGMGAVNIELGLWNNNSQGGLSRANLIVLVMIISLAVLVIALAAATIDRQASLAITSQARRFKTLSDSAMEGLIIHRDGQIIDCNAAAAKLLGIEGNPAGHWLDTWFGGLDPKIAEACIQTDADTPVEVALSRSDGTGFMAEVSGRPIELEDGGNGHAMAIRNVTARNQAERQLQHQALHDGLTDLPNRRLFVELAQRTLSQAQRNDTTFAIMMLNLDDFKVVNDIYGHARGDQLLIDVADRIRSALRDADSIARFGSDEFTILQSDVGEPKNVAVLAKRLVDRCSKPFDLGNTQINIAVSIGVAMFPDNYSSVEQMLRNANTAMYRAKADGKCTYRFFEPVMDEAMASRRRLESRLRKAINNELMTVSYQPLVDSRTRALKGFEALVRWKDDEIGFVSPMEFIPVAEETGLIIQLGEQVMRIACNDALSWPDDVRVAVNLSAIQFRSVGLVRMVREILKETGLPGNRLDLEITESILIQNREQVLVTLRELKLLGIRISMDDFGTGFSSLSYLQSFPFDKIKIDKSFVTDLRPKSQNQSIVSAITALGHSMKMLVVAEGVETEEQADLLLKLQCNEMQGYLIAKPMQASEVPGIISELEANKPQSCDADEDTTVPARRKKTRPSLDAQRLSVT